MKRWPLNTTHFWESSPFFRILLPLVAGIVCYDFGWLQGLSVIFLFIIIGLSFVSYVGSQFFPKSRNVYQVITFSFLQIIFFFSGFALSYFNDIRNDKNWFGNNIHSSSLARITDAPIEKDRSWKVPVTIVNTIGDGKVSSATGGAFLYLYKNNAPMLLHKGDSIIIPAKWQPIKNSGNPFEFDYSAYCRRNNLFYTQSCSPQDVQLYATNDPGHAPLLERSHDWCMRQLDKYVQDAKTRGLLQAMLLGDEVNLDEDLRQSYTDTGIVHIIAISGGNVAIFFIAISFLLLWVKNKKHAWIRYAIALPLVWFYVMMAGAQPSAIRAAIMFSLMAFAVMLEKNNNSLNQLFATAFLLLCAQPMWLFSVGFQLSFVAVLSLILFYKPVYKLAAPANKILRLLWETITASIAAEILVAPLVIYYFHTFPLLFIISNVLAYIFMSVVLIASIAIIALGFIPPVATGLGIGTVWVVTVFDNLIAHLQNFNPLSFHFLTLSEVELVCCYIIISGIALFLLQRQKRPLFIGMFASCILLCFLISDKWISLRQHHLIVYNTARASQIELIKGNNYFVLSTDTGVNKKIDYTVKPAHTYLHAWTKDSLPENEIFYVRDKKVLILNQEIQTTEQFPVDYLIVNYTAGVDLAALQHTFSPSKMILGGLFPSKLAEKLADQGRENNIPLYVTSLDGAFIY